LSIEQICHTEPESRDRIGNTELLDKFKEITQDYNRKISIKRKPSWEDYRRLLINSVPRNKSLNKR